LISSDFYREDYCWMEPVESCMKISQVCVISSPSHTGCRSHNNSMIGLLMWRDVGSRGNFPGNLNTSATSGDSLVVCPQGAHLGFYISFCYTRRRYSRSI